MFHFENKPKTSIPKPRLRYRLYRLQHGHHPPVFHIEIRFGDESFCAPLATADPDEAKRIYALMLAGKVTPCTAEEVLWDMQD